MHDSHASHNIPCLHSLLCWFLSVAGLILPSPCNTTLKSNNETSINSRLFAAKQQPLTSQSTNTASNGIRKRYTRPLRSSTHGTLHEHSTPQPCNTRHMQCQREHHSTATRLQPRAHQIEHHHLHSSSSEHSPEACRGRQCAERGEPPGRTGTVSTSAGCGLGCGGGGGLRCNCAIHSQ